MKIQGRYKFIILFFLLCLIFFSRNIIWGRVYYPLDILDRGFLYYPKGDSLHNLLIGDAILIFYPSDLLYNEYLKKGEILKWNPYIFSGYPEFASGQSATFHPVRLLLHYFLDPLTAHDAGLFIHLFLCCVFTFLYFKKLNLGDFPAATGGIVWSFSLAQMTWFEMERTVYTGAYIPLLLYFYEYALERNLLFYSSLGGVVLAFLLFTRHLQWALYGYLFFAFYFLFKFITLWMEWKKINHSLRPLLSFLIITILGFGLAAIQLIPTLELIHHSRAQRGGETSLLSYFSISALKGFPETLFHSIITFLHPFLLGSPVDRINLYPYTNFVEYQGYIGLFPLLSLLISTKNIRNPCITFYLFIFLLTFLMSLNTFLNIPFDLLVPGFSRLPHHRIIYITAFSGAVLSSYGMEILEKRRISFKSLLKTTIAFYAFWLSYVFLILIEHRKQLPSGWFLSNPIIHIPFLILPASFLILYIHFKGTGESFFRTTSLLVLLLDLLPPGFNFNTCAERSYTEMKDAYVTRVMGEEKELYRIIGVEPNWNVIFKKFSPEGYQSLYPDFYFSTLAENSPLTRHPLKVLGDMLSSTTAKLLGVKYIYINPWSDAKVEGASLIHSKWVKIYRTEEHLPRAFFVQNVIRAKEDWIINALRNNLFNPQEVLYLAEDFPVPEKASGEVMVKITEYSPHRVLISVHNAVDGFLVLSDAYYPGWKCYVDGREEKIYRAYTFLRAVFLKKGYHEVQFIYAPLSYKIGKSITILFSFITLLLALSFRKRKKARESKMVDEGSFPVRKQKPAWHLSIPLYLLIAMLFLENGRWIYLTSEHDRSRWYAQMAFLLQKTGEDEKALQFLERAVRFKQTAYEAHEGLGLILNSKGKLERALEHFEKAAKTIPNPRAYINCGAVKTKLKRYGEALLDLKKALELDPENHDAHYGLSVVYRALGDLSRAEEHRKRAEELEREK